MAIKLYDLEILIAIVDAGSISRAADNLNVPKSHVSRHLKQLEEELDTRLLDRTTRSLTLTEGGEIFSGGAQHILAELETLRARLSPDDSKLSGRLSVFAPGEFMSELLQAHLGQFSKRYPGLQLEFLSGSARPDLLHDRLDLIIHPDPPEDSSFVAIKLLSARMNFYAHPTYLERCGTPQHPSELYHHDCIAELTQDRRERPWLYRRGHDSDTAQIKPQFRCDTLTTARALALQGLGITMLPEFYVRQELEEGTLVTLFGGKDGVLHDVYGIYSSRRMKPRKLEVFLEFMKEILPPIV